jgi:hypothetical protein
MGDIYKNAQCNIGATGGEDGTEGLFFDRETSQFGRDTIQLKGRKHRRERFEFYVIDAEVGNALDKEPLNLRGWVFQERWLAPRMIHFAKTPLSWECR